MAKLLYSLLCLFIYFLYVQSLLLPNKRDEDFKKKFETDEPEVRGPMNLKSNETTKSTGNKIANVEKNETTDSNTIEAINSPEIVPIAFDPDIEIKVVFSKDKKQWKLTAGSVGDNEEKPVDEDKSEKPKDDKSGDDKSNDKSSGDKSDDKKSSGDKSDDDKSSGDKSDDKKSSGDKSDDDKSSGDKSDDKKSSGDKSDDDKSDGDKSSDDKSDSSDSDSKNSTESDQSTTRSPIFRPLTDADCAASRHFRLKVPGLCRTYYKCVRSNNRYVARKFNCKPGFFFSRRTNWCTRGGCSKRKSKRSQMKRSLDYGLNANKNATNVTRRSINKDDFQIEPIATNFEPITESNEDATSTASSLDDSPSGEQSNKHNDTLDKRRRTNKKRLEAKPSDRSDVRKRNRSLYAPSEDVARLSYNDFDLDEEEDIYNPNRFRINDGRLRSQVENSNIIVIADDDRNEDEEYEQDFQEENEQVDEEEPNDTVDRKDTNNAAWDRNRKENKVNEKETNATYVSPKEKINERRKDLIQKHENEDNSTIPEDVDRTRRMPKNITESGKPKPNVTGSNLKEKDLIEEKELIDKKELENNESHSMDKSRRTFKNTTIITESESYTDGSTARPTRRDNTRIVVKYLTTESPPIEKKESNGSSTSAPEFQKNQSDLNNKNESADQKEGNEFHNGRRIIKNVTIITEEEENYRKKDNLKDQREAISTSTTTTTPSPINRESSSESTFHNSRRIVKNITTITTEEEEENRKIRNKSELIRSEETPRPTTTTTPLPVERESTGGEFNNNSRRIIKNITTIIEESNSSSNGQNRQEERSTTTSRPSTPLPVDREPEDDVIKNNNRRIIKNITTIIEESNSSSNGQNRQEDRSTTTTTTPEPGIRESNTDEYQNDKRITKNVTITITEENSSSGRRPDQTEPIEDKNSDRLEHINKGSKPNTSSDLVSESNESSSGGRRVIKNITTIITEESNGSNRGDLSSKGREREIASATSTTLPPLSTSTINESDYHNGKRIIKNVTIITEESNISNRPKDERSRIVDIEEKKNETLPIGSKSDLNNKNDSTGQKEGNEFHNGKRIIKNVTTIITEEEETSGTNKNNFNGEPKEREIASTTTLPPLPTSTINESNYHNGKRIIKNVTIITEESNSSNRPKDKNNFNGEPKEREIASTTSTTTPSPTRDEYHSGKRIIKNITKIIEIEENNRRNEIVDNDRQKEGYKKIDEPSSINLPSNDSFGSGGRIIKKNTTIINEEMENSSNSSGRPSREMTRKNETSTESEDKLNESAHQPKLPCDRNRSDLKPIAHIIETHRIIKTLFGINYLSGLKNGSFVRQVRKNVTKVITPDNLDDATSMILNKNVPNYLVNEIHEIEEKVIFENPTDSFSDQNRPPQANTVTSTTRSPINSVTTPTVGEHNIAIEYSPQPIISRPISTSRPLIATTRRRPVSIDPFTDPIDTSSPSYTTSRSDINSHGNSIYTIDPHGSLDESSSTVSTTPRPCLSCAPSNHNSNNLNNNNSLPISTARPPETLNFPNPQGPVFFDETNDCKREGFHLDEHDEECKRFYLCKRDSSTGRYVIQDFVCVPGQVFVLERKVCVYSNMSSACSLRRSANNNTHHPTESSVTSSFSNESSKPSDESSSSQSVANRKEEESTITAPITRSTELPILFTDHGLVTTERAPDKESDSSSPAHDKTIRSGSVSLTTESTPSESELISAGSNANLRIRVRPISNSDFAGQRVQQQQNQPASSLFPNIPYDNRLIQFAPYQPLPSIYTNNPMFTINSFLLQDARQRAYPAANNFLLAYNPFLTAFRKK